MILIGFMGSGKTTIAENIARELNVKCLDIDEEITKKYDTSISQIFSKEGEEGFRKKEFEVLNSSLNKDAVISTGGGVVTYKASLELLKSQSKHKIFYLDAPFQVLYDRIKGDDTRPLANQDREKVHALYENRLELYKSAGDFTIDTEKSIFEITQEIIDLND